MLGDQVGEIPTDIPLFNKVLTIPKAGITSIVINGNGGDDSFTTGIFLSLGTTVTLNGGDGDDTFALLGMAPSSPLTKFVVNGGNSVAGDTINLDLSLILFALGTVTVGTKLNGTTSVSSFLSPLLDYTSVEIATLRDNNQATNFAQGDFYARGGSGADKFDLKDVLDNRQRPIANQATFSYPSPIPFLGSARFRPSS